MAKIKAVQTLVVEDFPDQKNWIGKMFYLINRFIVDVVSNLNGGLLFESNIAGQEHEFNFTYADDNTTFPMEFKWNLAQKPRAYQIVSATEEASSSILVGVLVVGAFEYTAEGNVRLKRLARIDTTPALQFLQNGYRYRIIVRVSP